MKWLKIALITLTTALTGCQSTQDQSMTRLMEQSQGIMVDEAHYYKLLNTYYTNSKQVDYAEFWNSYNRTGYSANLVQTKNRFYEELNAVDAGNKKCTDIDWKTWERQLFFSIWLHREAQNCFGRLELNEQSDYYQSNLSYLLKGMFDIADGRSADFAYQVLTVEDAASFIDISGLTVFESYITTKANGWGIYLVYVTQDMQTNAQKEIHFDISRLIHSGLTIDYPLGWIDHQIHQQLTLELAKEEVIYKIAASRYHQIKEDFDAAANELMSAVAEGSSVASYHLGVLCEEHPLSTMDKSTCFDHFLSAAQNGYAPAVIYLAAMYYQGHRVEKDTVLFEQLMTKASDLYPSGRAWYELSRLSFIDEESKHTFKQQAADEGSEEAQLFQLQTKLGQLIDEKADPEIIKQQFDAIRPLIKRADLSYQHLHAIARYVSQVRFKFDDAFVQQTAMDYQRLAKTGGLISLQSLATDLEKNTPKEFTIESMYKMMFESIDKIYATATRGNVQAQYRMAKFFDVDKSAKAKENAQLWYLLCSSLGNNQCLLTLSQRVLFENSDLFAPDKAAEFIKNIADHGNAEAQYLYFLALSSSKGVARDETQARHYLVLAAKQNHENALLYLCNLSKRKPQLFDAGELTGCKQ